MKRLLLFFIAFGISTVSFNQNLNFYGFLPSISQTGIVSKKIDYNFFTSLTDDAFDRHFTNSALPYNEVDYPAKILQVYIQPSIIYKYSPKLNFTASITYNYQRNNPNVHILKNGGFGSRLFIVSIFPKADSPIDFDLKSGLLKI